MIVFLLFNKRSDTDVMEISRIRKLSSVLISIVYVRKIFYDRTKNKRRIREYDLIGEIRQVYDSYRNVIMLRARHTARLFVILLSVSCMHDKLMENRLLVYH